MTASTAMKSPIYGESLEEASLWWPVPTEVTLSLFAGGGGERGRHLYKYPFKLSLAAAVA